MWMGLDYIRFWGAVDFGVRQKLNSHTEYLPMYLKDGAWRITWKINENCEQQLDYHSMICLTDHIAVLARKRIQDAPQHNFCLQIVR